MATTTRAEHLQWSKDRALEYLENGDITNAWASMISDLRKHEATADHLGLELGAMQVMAGQLTTVADMRHFIEGFN